MSEKLQIGDVLRYAKPKNAVPREVDGLLNFHYLASFPNAGAFQLERGINAPAKVTGPDGIPRRPAVLISSSPHKKGSAETPWQDFFDPDNGHIRYFGDNKNPGSDPAQSSGNKVLLELFHQAHSHDENLRRQTPPILFFRRATYKGKSKGYPQFEGFGVVTSAELITQWDNTKERSFSNYVFDFTIFSLSAEHEEFDWTWINERRDSSRNLNQTLNKAPSSWKIWLKGGSNSLSKVRRRVAKLFVMPTETQLPEKGSETESVLYEIYDYYHANKHAFEALAEVIAERVLGGKNSSYVRGWITSAASDGGTDFVARVTLGSGLSRARLVVLGQAKCEKPSNPTGGNHIARTVARLRRGWIGVYVTTSYFSKNVQEEVIQDRYPIALINGLRVAEEVQQILHESDQFADVKGYLDHLTSEYPGRVLSREPEEILTVS